MKQFFSLLLFASVGFLFAQDTLNLKVKGLGSQKYVLYEDGSFIYRSYLCGHTYISFGDYRKNIFGYKFTYDTARCPNDPFMIEYKSETTEDSVTLMFFDLIDSMETIFYGLIMIDFNMIHCQSSSIKISKSDIRWNKVFFEDSQRSFNFDSSSSVLKFILVPLDQDMIVEA